MEENFRPTGEEKKKKEKLVNGKQIWDLFLKNKTATTIQNNIYIERNSYFDVHLYSINIYFIILTETDELKLQV